jgi:DNA-binding transcriptional MerR regulator
LTVSIKQFAKETGMPLSTIKRHAELFKQGDNTIPERKQMMLEHKKKAEEQLAQTLKHLRRINYKLALYDVMEKNILVSLLGELRTGYPAHGQG